MSNMVSRHKRWLALVLGVMLSLAAVSVALANIKPEKADSIEVASTGVKFVDGTASMECQVNAMPGTIEAGTTSAKLSAPGLHGPGESECSPGEKVTTSGKWKLEEVSKTEGRLELPARGVVISLHGSLCVLTLAPSAAVKISGTWANGQNSTTAPSSLELNEASVPIEESNCGGFGSTIKMSGRFLVSDITAPASAVVFG
jgi:hypothetical protein